MSSLTVRFPSTAYTGEDLKIFYAGAIRKGTYDHGLTIRDAAGTLWNYNGEGKELVKDPHGIFKRKGIITNIFSEIFTIKIPNDMSTGGALLLVSVWKPVDKKTEKDRSLSSNWVQGLDVKKRPPPGSQVNPTLLLLGVVIVGGVVVYYLTKEK